MDIVRHPNTNHDFGAPPDMQDGSCENLPVVLVRNEHGTWACSYWKPSGQELEALAAGGAIQLGVRLGGDDGSHPVVLMAVTKEAL
jgi:hypothetical protein